MTDDKQPTMEDWRDEYPAPVTAAADAYDKAHAAHQKSKEKLNTARDNAIAIMQEHDCPRVPIRNGEKYLQLDKSMKVVIQKPKSDKDEDDD